eukprot:TRINITY_DN307_c0_g1_i1.p2 TRINITY_DN307_c0_g1~~TRINITY_DN307_c0_g1_i1.p2  ORF type:complete len:91 (-),score=16.08 TRINITY_DN307_c0_g1_i1:27-299(-)
MRSHCRQLLFRGTTTYERRKLLQSTSKGKQALHFEMDQTGEIRRIKLRDGTTAYVGVELRGPTRVLVCLTSHLEGAGGEKRKSPTAWPLV